MSIHITDNDTFNQLLSPLHDAWLAADLHESLKNFHLYAGDGHFHAASSHDDRNDKSKKDAVGHLYSLNLRNHLFSHLTLASDGSKKKPHDIGALERMEVEELRQGAKKGQQLTYIWDRAGIDFL